MTTDKLFPVVLLPLAAVAVLAIVSPRILISWLLGGPKDLRAPARELFLRIAGTLFLIGAVIVWLRELNT